MTLLGYQHLGLTQTPHYKKQRGLYEHLVFIMLLYLSYQSCIEQYPQNTPTDFTYELPKDIHCLGDWNCTLKELHTLTKPRISPLLCIYCDIVEPSPIFGKLKTILRIARPNTTLLEESHKISVNPLRHINFKIRDIHGNVPDLRNIHLTYVLCVYKQGVDDVDTHFQDRATYRRYTA